MMPYQHFLIPVQGGEVEVQLDRFIEQTAILKVNQKFIESTATNMATNNKHHE
jgi:hypothetical protein